MIISRRNFFRLTLGAVATEAIPFNRVWSFPTKIVLGQFRMDSGMAFIEFELEKTDPYVYLPLERVTWNADLIFGRQEQIVARACVQYLDMEALRKDFLSRKDQEAIK